LKYFSRSRGRKEQLRPPDLYEYSVDNYWFRSADFEAEPICPRLRGSHKADVVIVGGGYTGLSAAYHIHRKFPGKKIVLVEGARCGYGASGRNGGFCITTDWIDGLEGLDPEECGQALDVASYGLRQIKHLIAEYGLECDLEENGMLDVALTDKQVKSLADDHALYGSLGLESTLLDGDELKTEIDSPVFKAGLMTPYGAILDPAKLVLGMKRIAEAAGVEIWERTVVTRVTPGGTVLIDTELGEIRAPVLVVATNAYSHKLGFFRNRVVPVGVFQIATAALSPSQWESIGWHNRRGLADAGPLFSYSRPTADGRIVIGGVDSQYYAGDSLTSGNDKAVTRAIEAELLRFFPQLEGLGVEHAWGGTTALTIGNTPSVGVMSDDRNIFFGVGFSEGVPSSQTAGRIIADLMAGESNEFTNHYVVNHDIPYSGPTALRGVFARGTRWLMKTFDLSLYR
jgi:glycine/D-amino acid oxidase-like deaminating enzyme